MSKLMMTIFLKLIIEVHKLISLLHLLHKDDDDVKKDVIFPKVHFSCLPVIQSTRCFEAGGRRWDKHDSGASRCWCIRTSFAF